MITFLLSKTELKVKIGTAVGPNFRTVIGTPQGDALSPILFLVYLEHILKNFRTDNKHLIEEHEYEFGYADDMYYSLRDKDDTRRGKHVDEVDYRFDQECNCAKCRAEQIETILPEYMQEYHMKMNGDKTLHVEWTKGMTRNTSIQILGNNISPDFEIKMRKSKAANALNLMYNTWIQKENTVSTDTKVYLYNTFVRPHLLYNAGSCPYLQHHLDKLDSFHRRQLRRVLGIFYPAHISNSDVYIQTDSIPISVMIGTMRWAHLGHILRLDEKAPAQLAMRNYFSGRVIEEGRAEERTEQRPARLFQTLPRIININLKVLKEYSPNVLGNLRSITSATELSILKRYAENSKKWYTDVVVNMEKALLQEFNRREVNRRQKLDVLEEEDNVEQNFLLEGNNAQPTDIVQTLPEEQSNNTSSEDSDEVQQVERRIRRRQRGRPRTRPVPDPNAPRRPRGRPRTQHAAQEQQQRRNRPSRTRSATTTSSSNDIREYFSQQQ
jgi:hypothetical protein